MMIVLGVGVGLTLAALDAVGNQIILWTAAAAGVLWAIVHVVKPGVRFLRSLFRSAAAFEDLPTWMAWMEAELAKVVAAVSRVENRQRAQNRVMGVHARGEKVDADDEFDIEDGVAGALGPSDDS